MYKCKSGIVGGVLCGVGISVKAEKTPFGAESREDGARVASAAESDIRINSFRLNIQTVDRLREECRNMIGRRCHVAKAAKENFDL